MVAYGPWTQGPDYDRGVTWDVADRGRVLQAAGGPTESTGYVYDEEITDDPPYSVAPYERLETMLSTALVQNDDDGGGFGEGGHVALSYGTQPLSGLSKAASDVSTSVSLAPIVPGIPTSSMSYPAGWAPFTYFPDGDIPDGAIGVEFEGVPGWGWDSAPVEWLDVEILPNTRLTGEISESGGPAGAGVERQYVSGPFVTEIRAAAGFPGPELGTMVHGFTTPVEEGGVGGTAGSNSGRDLGTAVSLTSALGAGGAGGMAWMRPITYVPPSILPNGDAWSVAWTYGWAFYEFRLLWRLHPPRYRWVFDSVPFRRTFPRDDGLAGGAGRTWPPPKSQQESRRTFGGYL